MVWLAALGFGIVSALVPVLNAEVYIGVTATRASPAVVGAAVVALAVGQTAGKVVWYLAARRAVESAWVQKKLSQPKVQQGMTRWSERLRSRPVLAALVLFSSALLGVPPLLILAVVAGTVRVPLPVFVVTTAVGRAGRFAAFAAGAEWAVRLL